LQGQISWHALTFEPGISPLCLQIYFCTNTNDAPFNFDDECLDAFYYLKKALIFVPIIQPPDWSLPFEIVDAIFGHYLWTRILKLMKYRLADERVVTGYQGSC